MHRNYEWDTEMFAEQRGGLSARQSSVRVD